MLDYKLYDLATALLLGWSPLLFAILMFVDAPYGKRDRGGWGPALPIRWAWFLLELPSFLVPVIMLVLGGALPGLPGSLLLLFWLGHYGYRTFIYPLRLRARPGASFKWVMVLLGMPMNGLIGYLMASMALGEAHLQEASWLLSPPFIVGTLLALIGLVITRAADRTLRALRAPGESGYAIPQGGLYRWISCPNYFGEVLQWFGFALAAWCLPPLAFAVYTAANLVPRALASHRWYRETFTDYPAERRAFLPYLL